MIQGYKGKALIMADEMRAYDPTIRERMASALQGGMEGMGVNRYKARKHAQTIAGGDSSNLPLGMGIADFVPFVGTTMGLEEGARDLGNAAEAVKRGDYIDAAADTAGAAMGLIPGGYSTYKTGKNMLKKLKTIDLPKLKLIETDSVPKKSQSLKEWAMAGGGVPASHKDRADVWHKKAQNFAGGGAVKKVVREAVEGVVQGMQKILAPAEREANKVKFLEGSKTPMVLYHGTTATEGGKGKEAIRRIKPSKEGALGSGVYLTPSSAHASGYSGIANDEAIEMMLRNPLHQDVGLKALNQRNSGNLLPSQEGGNMLPVHAQIRNPLELHMESRGQDPMVLALTKLGMDEDKAARMVEKAYEDKGYIGKQVQQRAQAQGYDGLMQYRDGDLSEVVSYNPNAVKSSIGNRGTYDVTRPDLNEAHGGAIHMAKGGKVKNIVKEGLEALFGKADKVPKGVEPIVVRTPEEREVIDKFGQKQDQEAARQKKVEKAAKESASQSPEDQAAKPAKSKGPRVKSEADTYRKMAETQGDEAVLKAARAGEHLKPTKGGYVGAPRTVTSGQGLGAMRKSMDTDFADSVKAVRLANPERLGTWYDRAKQGIAESTEPYQLPRTLEQHGVFSAGVSPESELAFSLKHLNSRNAGDPQMAYRGAGMRNLDNAVAQDRPANMGFKIGEYANKNDPRLPNTGLFGVNDFRRAQGMGYTDTAGNPWHEGVRDTMHPFMDAETALQVSRSNEKGIGGRTDWQGPHIQEVPWVYGKAQDLHGRGLKGRYAGDELEGIKSSIQDANNTARDYMYKHAASATHEQIPGASLGHVRQALDMTPEEKLAYGRQGRFDLPAPEAALNEYPEVGAGNRDAIYSALGYRQLPSRQAEGLYVNSLGGVETNPMTIARPLMDFPTGGGGGRMAEDSSKMMDTAEQFRALMDAQEAGAYNLPNSMDSVKGKNAMVLDTRGINPDRLADPSAGVLPTAEQLSQINKLLGEASGKAEQDAIKVREKMPYGPPTKSVARKLEGLDDAAGGYGVTATNRGALVFPYNSGSGSGGLNEIMKGAGSGLEAAFPGAQRQKAVASTGYVPGVGKRSAEGPQPTAPFSGEATSDMLRAFSELPPTVSQNLSESESVRAAIRDKALRDSKMGGTRRDIQETRRFFSEADWPRAVEMIRKGMTPAAALAALGYSASSMAGDKR